MAIPFEGQCADAPEAPGRQLDRLAAGEDGFDDVRSQESELNITPDVARVDPIAPGNLLDGPDFSSRQLIEPAPRLGDQGDQVLIGRRGFALRRADNQLCLDTAAPQSHRNGAVNQPFRARSSSSP